MHTLYFLIGASGAGKTTAMKALEKRRPDIVFRHFDPIGVEFGEEMAKKNMSGEEWQRQLTMEWVKRIKAELLEHAPVILDGRPRNLQVPAARTRSTRPWRRRNRRPRHRSPARLRSSRWPT